ncbi:MAG: class I SAM-dependent methyltransferase, partial [Caldilineaceae bacterium]|nr:class I SAM-dependent methyltransferase [Caldilineaceae bacterium]
GILGDVAGKRVLCLAASAGQQSPAFALLGAQVTVFDLSPAQLERDREAAAHYGLEIETVQGDMRDLSAFEDATFDVVWQAYSINFVPDVRPVLAEASRVLKPDGLYRIQWANPFTQLIDEESWTGEGYILKHPYVDGASLIERNPHWNVWDVTNADGSTTQIASPREFVHALSAVVNALVANGLVILHLSEWADYDPDAEPGSWEYYKAVAPLFLTIWAMKRPALFD